MFVKAINKSDPNRKILKKFLQFYKGLYQIKKQIRPGTCIQWNPEFKEEKGIFHSQNLKICIKSEENSKDKENSKQNNVGSE